MTNQYSITWFETFLEPVPAEQTAREADFLTRQLPNPPYAIVLDLGCGYGRHARELTRRGYRVTGIDVNPLALEAARQKSPDGITYLELDMRNVALIVDTFHAVICLWQSFGYFDEETNRAIIRDICRKLHPRGRFILDIYHRGFFVQAQGTRYLERNGQTITETRRVSGKTLTVRLEYERGGSDAFEWQLYSPEEICDEALAAGFESLLACTDFDEEHRPSSASPRMQLVFQKVA